MNIMDEKTNKKAYRTPELVIYGDVRELTWNLSSAGTVADGGSTPNTKTGV